MYFFILFKASMFPALAASIIYCHLNNYQATNYASRPLSSTQQIVRCVSEVTASELEVMGKEKRGENTDYFRTFLTLNF